MADRDDEFLELLLDSDDPSEDDLRKAIKRITIARSAVPVLCGAALRNVGVQPLLDAVVDFLPSPQDRRPVQAMLKKDETLVDLAPEERDPFCALAFKVMYQESQSRLTYLRVYSGTLLPGDDLHNPTREITERPKRFYRLYADKRLKIDRIAAGDVVAVAGLGKAVTGDTLCAPSRPVILAESMSFPIPVVSVAVEPRTKKDEERLTRAMEKLGVEDPTFSVREDKETGQTLISGMGELHLEVIVRRLEENFQVDARVGKPQVAYKETVETVATAEEVFEKQLAGKLHWARVVLSVGPADQGRGILYREAPDLAQVPLELREAAEQTLHASATAGVLLGYPMVDVKAQLLTVEYNADNPSPMAVAGATSKAFLSACSQASPVLLEPQVRLEISLPVENLGGVVESLNARGGRVLDMAPRSVGHGVSAVAPMSTMFGYATELRSLTQGRGTLFMKFSHFAKRAS
jgi:elongation factor G